MHPIERLRAVARARDVEQSLLASEAAAVLGSLAFDPMGLLTSCRRLLDRHPAAGALWWTCARLLAADDARAEARAVAQDLDDDPSHIDLGLELPEAAVVAVVPDAAGGSQLAVDLAGLRDDLEVVAADRPVGRGPRGVLLVEAGAAGPHAVLAPPGTGENRAAAGAAGTAVWVVVAVGRRLPAPLFDAVVARAGAAVGEVVSLGGVDRVIEPRQVSCPCPPELLRPSAGW